MSVIHQFSIRSNTPVVARLAFVLIVLYSSLHASESGFLNQPRLGGDWAGVITKLEEIGIEPDISYKGESISNLRGGKRTGTSWEGFLSAGLNIYPAHWGGPAESRIYLDFFWYHGSNPSTMLLGDFNGVSNMRGGDMTSFAALWYEQSLNANEWFFKIGQIAADDDFMRSEYATGLFIQSAIGSAPRAVAGNVNFPSYPTDGPGGIVRWTPNHSLQFQVGAYIGDAGEQISSNHGFDWRAGGAAGYTGFAEALQRFEVLDRTAIVRGGGFYNSGTFTRFKDPYGSRRIGDYGFWLGWDQTLTAKDTEGREVGIFVRTATAPSPQINTVVFSLSGGTVIRSPFPSRPKDEIGLGAAYTRFGSDYTQASRRQGSNMPSYETSMELTYKLHLTPFLWIQPDLQYFHSLKSAEPDAIVAGIRARVQF